MLKSTQRSSLEADSVPAGHISPDVAALSRWNKRQQIVRVIKQQFRDAGLGVPEFLEAMGKQSESNVTMAKRAWEREIFSARHLLRLACEVVAAAK